MAAVTEVCTKCGGSVNHTQYAVEVRRRMEAGVGGDGSARLFKGDNGTKLGASYGGGQVALVGFTADLSDFSEVRLTPGMTLDLAKWLVEAAEKSKQGANPALADAFFRALRGSHDE